MMIVQENDWKKSTKVHDDFSLFLVVALFLVVTAVVREYEGKYSTNQIDCSQPPTV